MRVEILKQESDPQAKYELFQRLNTGGTELSEQEVRNCVAVMVNKKFHEWLVGCASNGDFLITIDQTEYALKKQTATELALRFFVFRNIPYQSGLDVHEYLDMAMMKIATSSDFDFASEKSRFDRTFALAKGFLGQKAFKRWNGTDFHGKFLMSVFEVLAIGLSKNLEAVEQMSPEDQKTFIIQRAKNLWSDSVFLQNSGAGIRGTTRLANLLPMAEDFLRP